MGAKKKGKKGAKKGGDKKASAGPSVSSAEQMAYKLQATEAQLEDCRERIKRLTHDNEELRRNREKVEKDTHEFVAYFQKEMEKKDDLVADLRYNLRQTEVSKERELREMRDKFTSEIDQKDNAFSSTERELRLRLSSAEEELQVLYDFKAHKKELEAKLRDQEQQLVEKDLQSQKTQAAQERKFIEEKARMQKEHEKQLARIKKKSREEAQKGLDADTRRIITDNRRMGEELRFQLKTTDELQHSKEAIEDQNRKLKREVDLYAEKEKEYAKGGHRKTREIRDLTAQVQTLERSLAQVVRDFERDREQLLTKHKGENDELTLEVNGLRQLIKLKNKELRTIKKLAQTILQQRTEVERFFLEALSQVKDEIAAARAEHRAKGNVWDRRGGGSSSARGATKFPSLDGSGRAQSRGGGGDKIDLNELSPEDRERVLRLLFAKINNVQSYAGTFDHSMSAPESSFEASADPRGGSIHQVDIPFPAPALASAQVGGAGAGGGAGASYRGTSSAAAPDMM